MTKTYINERSRGLVETIDEFESHKEALKMLSEYRMAFSHGSDLYLSQRSTKDWRAAT